MVERAVRLSNRIEILVEPNDTTAAIGSNVNLSAVVRSPQPSFQWYDKNGEKVPMGIDSKLSIGCVRAEDFGFYRLEILDTVVNEKVLTRWVELKSNIAPQQPQQDIGMSQRLVIHQITILSLPGGPMDISSNQSPSPDIMLHISNGNTLIFTNWPNTIVYLMIISPEPVTVRVNYSNSS